MGNDEEIRETGEGEQPEAESEATPETEPAGSSDELQRQLAEAQQEVERSRSELLRAQAELENVRKRAERDVEKTRRYALEKFAEELLPVKDSLELALAAVGDENASVEKFREGTELTLKMLDQAFEKFEIQEVNPEGERFDPQHHEAMSMQESEQQAPNTVLNVYQKGYLLNDRLIRPAMVTVAKAPGGGGSESSQGAAGSGESGSEG